ncbi:MAG: ribosome assembly RNA-binding protein YhbY [Polyangiaceae bacterium]
MAVAKKPTRAAAPKKQLPSKPSKRASGKAAPRRRIELSGAQKSYLRGLAHELKPVVQIGHAGITDGVVRQIDDALETHELIKVKLAKESPVEPAEAGEPLEKQLTASLAQRIGRILVLYRPRLKQPTIKLPR